MGDFLENLQDAWEKLNKQIINCKKCERLINYCRAVATKKRRAYLNWQYWGKPVPNFGDPYSKFLIVGLAPAAHGANRTGRLFTGDRSGDFLYRALWKAGFSNSPRSLHRDDGITLKGCAITAVLHCAPPANKPLNEEIRNCFQWLTKTLDTVPARVYLALGTISFYTILKYACLKGICDKRMPEFKHGSLVEFNDGSILISSYHPSQQNVFTGRLTEEMFDNILMKARNLL